MGMLDDIHGEVMKLTPKGPPARKLFSSMGSMQKPTKVERMLLIASAAQLLAGPGKTPTREQLDRARKGVDKKIATSSMAGWTSSTTMGGFWDKVKSLAVSAGGAAVRLATGAAGFVAKNPGIVLPLAGAVVASPFLLKAISAASQSTQAQEEAAAGPPPPPPPNAVTLPAPPAANVQVPTQEEEAILGLHNGWDERDTESGDDFVVGAITEEERELARAGGSSEQESMERMYGCSSAMGADSVEHDAYRASILKKAVSLAGKGKAPSTREFFLAKRAVDRILRRRGMRVAIPGAAPGRRTR